MKNLDGLEIFLGYKCNVKCTFCYQKDLRYVYRDNIKPNIVKKNLLEGRKNNKKFIIFSGGEATLDSFLGEYISYAKEIGYDHIRVHTNGFRFSNIDYLEGLYDRGLTGVILSVHGYKKIHDIISQVDGSFGIIEKALINFEKLKKRDLNFVFDTNTVICKANYRSIKILFLFLLKFSISRRMLVYPYNIDSSQDTLQKLLPENKEYIPYILELCEEIYQRDVRDFVLETIPYCIIPSKYWKYIDENYKTDKDVILIDRQVTKQQQYVEGKIKLEDCKKCKKYEKCYGFSVDYIQLYRDIKINPIS